MIEKNHTRRTVLKAIGAGIAGVLATGRASAATPFEEELATVREATEQYHDVTKALEDGFQPGGPYVPGQGWHWIHPERVRAAAKNGPSLEEPQVLVYADTEPTSPEGHLVLGAAEWGIPVETHGEGGGHDHGDSEAHEDHPDLFSDGEAPVEEHWHVHHESRHVFASGDGERTDPSGLSVAQLLQRGQWAEVPPHEEMSPGDEVTADWGLTGTEETRTVDLVPEPHPSLLTLHAWVHLPNRNHVLAGVNPNVEYVKMLPNEMMADHTAKPGAE